jgi:hypothetical protein
LPADTALNIELEEGQILIGVAVTILGVVAKALTVIVTGVLEALTQPIELCDSA